MVRLALIKSLVVFLLCFQAVAFPPILFLDLDSSETKKGHSFCNHYEAHVAAGLVAHILNLVMDTRTPPEESRCKAARHGDDSEDENKGSTQASGERVIYIYVYI